jgi:hypothetical protein
MAMGKRFNINGREVEWYHLTDNEIVDLLEKVDTSSEDKEFLNKQLIDRFKRNCCARPGETNNDVFVRQFSDYVNGKMQSEKVYDREAGKDEWIGGEKACAKKMAVEHRYLQQEMFKVCLEYIKVLAKNYENGIYDGRNEWFCKTSNGFVDYCKENDIWL